MKGQAITGLSILLLILGIITGTIIPSDNQGKGITPITDNNTYWCYDTDQSYTCSDFINNTCTTDSGNIKCGVWKNIHINQTIDTTTQRTNDYVTDNDGRDWVCPNLTKTSKCTFGTRTTIYGDILTSRINGSLKKAGQAIG